MSIIPTTETLVSLTDGVAQQIIAEDNSRVVAVVDNLTGGDVWLKLTGMPSIGDGFLLSRNESTNIATLPGGSGVGGNSNYVGAVNALYDKVKQAYGNQPTLPTGNVLVTVGHRTPLFMATARNLTLANAATFSALIQTGANVVELFFGALLGGDGSMDFTEGVSFSTAGVVQTPRDVNRVQEASPVSTIVSEAPTGVSGGVVLLDEIILGGSAQNQNDTTAGAGGGSPVPWLLKENTNYSIDLTNLSGADQVAEITIGFTERP